MKTRPWKHRTYKCQTNPVYQLLNYNLELYVILFYLSQFFNLMARLRKAVNNLRAKSHGYLTLSPRDDQPVSLEDQEEMFRAKILSCYELCLAYEDKEAQAEARRVVPLDDLKLKARAKFDCIIDKRQNYF